MASLLEVVIADHVAHLTFNRPERRNAFGGFVREQVRIREIPALLVSHDAGDAAFADGDAVRLG